MDLRRVAVVFAVAALSLTGGDSPRGTPAPDAHRPDRISVLHPADGLGAVVAASARGAWRVAGGGVEVDRRVVPAPVTAELVDP
jgi:hypothetical protein